MKGKILIVGTGALASLFAARLRSVEYEIWMLGTWLAAIDALNENGVTIQLEQGEQETYPVNAISDPRKCMGVSRALVLVKSWQTERVAGQLQECLSQQGLALSLQNGLGNRERLIAALGKERVAQGSTTTGATLIAPGHVRPGGEGLITLGNHTRLDSLQNALEEASFDLKTVDRLDSLLWGKLVINVAINPLTALLEIPNGELLEQDWVREWMHSLALEVQAVAFGLGVELPFQDPFAAAEDVARRTSGNHSSMLQDVLRRAPTEIDAICGVVVEMGKKVSVQTPRNQIMWDMVRAKVKGEKVNLEPLHEISLS